MKLEQAARQAFETWWEREGQEFLYALNTTTDDDIKLVAEIAWKNGAYGAEQAKQADGGHWSPDDMAYRPGGLSMDQEQESNSIFMEGYRIGLAEMREKCAKVVTEHAPTCSPDWVSYVVAIRSIKFEGDTGFRPVSEMIAEHKQDPKKKAAIERAELRKQVAALKAVVDAWNNVEQEPVAIIEKEAGFETEVYATGYADSLPDGVFKLYTAPVRTKDLTDIEDLQDAVTKALKKAFQLGQTYWQQADSESYAANKRADVTQELYWKLEDDTRAVIAADREKNK